MSQSPQKTNAKVNGHDKVKQTLSFLTFQKQENKDKQVKNQSQKTNAKVNGQDNVKQTLSFLTFQKQENDLNKNSKDQVNTH